MSRLRTQLNLLTAWLLYFIAWRLVFLLYNWHRSKELSASDLFRVFGYGLRLDLSMTGYLLVPSFLIILISYAVPKPAFAKAVRYLSYGIVVLISLFQTVDLELYKAWGYRMDATPFQYLSHPKEMLASSGGAPWVILLLIWIGLTFFGIWLFRKLLGSWKLNAEKNSLLKFALSLFFTIALILPIRGGWQQIPINQSAAYFSAIPFANHAALNLPWNIGYSAWRSEQDQTNPYQYLDDARATELVRSLYPETGRKSASILKSKRPNVLFIILESYTAGYLGCLGGEPGVTPNLDSIAAEGLLFNRVFASADRSEKGLVALLSGFPNQPATSVMKQPRKTEHLPTLAKSLRAAGYNTSFYYGGEMAFANMKTYLLAGGYQKLVEKKDFDKKDYNSKWGVHDHVLFNRLLKEIPEQKPPFFTTVFTLSSHEPYEIPVPGKFKGTDEATQFKNSVHYTDQALGDFIRKAKKQSWWDNTLVVIVADHGHRFPSYSELYMEAKFHIPLVFTGGALDTTGRVELVASQTDVATTLLKQLDLPTGEYHWGKDLLSPASKPFAFYTFNNGLCFVTDRGYFSFSNDSRKIIETKRNVTPEDIESGKAYLQKSYNDFLSR